MVNETLHRRGKPRLGFQQHGMFDNVVMLLVFPNADCYIPQPVFFIRDPIKFPSMNRSHKRHPQTHLPDANMVSHPALDLCADLMRVAVLGVCVFLELQ